MYNKHKALPVVSKGRTPPLAEKISLIIPLRLTANTYEGALRLSRLCATVPRDLFDIVISDYGTQEAYAGPIRALEAEGIAVVRHPAPGKLFSIGHARDFGVQMARQRIVLFNDIDFLGTPAMYRQIHAEAVRRNIGANLFDFFCVPVLFLTEEGTRAWFAAIEKGELFLRQSRPEWLEQAASDIQFTAFGSSAMVVNRHHYLSLGGHDANFSGHGAEDYDLLHRLASLAPKGPRPNDYFTDFKDNGVRSFWGFRAFFALHGLDVLARDIHLVHLWHPRRMEKGYFRSRPNFRHLKRLMLRFDRMAAMPLPLTDPARTARWLVFYRTAADLALLRQLLPLSGYYRLTRTRGLPSASGLAGMAKTEGADTIVIAPGVRGKTGSLGPEASLRDMCLVHFRAGADPNSLELTTVRTAVETRATVRSHAILSESGKVLFRMWPRLDLGGGAALESGDIPPPEPLSSPIFSTFGGETLLDKAVHPRPGRKKKSGLWVKLKRRLTGY